MQITYAKRDMRGVAQVPMEAFFAGFQHGVDGSCSRKIHTFPPSWLKKYLTAVHVRSHDRVISKRQR